MKTRLHAGSAARWLAALLAVVLCAAPAGAAAPDVAGPVVQGEPPPDFALPDTAGRTVHLGDFKGRVILLSFVSCYTDTCLAAVNSLERLFTKLGPSRVAAPTICAEVPDVLKQDGYAGLRKRCGAGQTILIDEAQATVARYHVTEYPTSLLIGPDFTVREIIRGAAALRDPALGARIEALATEGATRAPGR